MATRTTGELHNTRSASYLRSSYSDCWALTLLIDGFISQDLSYYGRNAGASKRNTLPRIYSCQYGTIKTAIGSSIFCANSGGHNKGKKHPIAWNQYLLPSTAVNIVASKHTVGWMLQRGLIGALNNHEQHIYSSSLAPTL